LLLSSIFVKKTLILYAFWKIRYCNTYEHYTFSQFFLNLLKSLIFYCIFLFLFYNFNWHAAVKNLKKNCEEIYANCNYNSFLTVIASWGLYSHFARGLHDFIFLRYPNICVFVVSFNESTWCRHACARKPFLYLRDKIEILTYFLILVFNIK